MLNFEAWLRDSFQLNCEDGRGDEYKRGRKVGSGDGREMSAEEMWYMTHSVAFSEIDDAEALRIWQSEEP
jgi:hypothetical protein